ncbi:MAG: hypothetical protein LBU65_00620 [Planctomycetaceae bacterium]|nr:hypothetical protein [Planctomycetaceae bacterium]
MITTVKKKHTSDKQRKKDALNKNTLSRYEKIYEELADYLFYNLQEGKYYDKVNEKLTPSEFKKASTEIVKITKTGKCMDLAFFLSMKLDGLKINNWLLYLDHPTPGEMGHMANLFEIDNQLFVADLTKYVDYIDVVGVTIEKNTRGNPRPIEFNMTLDEYMKTAKVRYIPYVARFDEKSMMLNRIQMDAFLELRSRLKNDKKYRDDFAEYNKTHPRIGYEKDALAQQKKDKEKVLGQLNHKQDVPSDTKVEKNQAEDPLEKLKKIAMQSASVLELVPYLPKTIVSEHD